MLTFGYIPSPPTLFLYVCVSSFSDRMLASSLNILVPTSQKQRHFLILPLYNPPNQIISTNKILLLNLLASLKFHLLFHHSFLFLCGPDAFLGSCVAVSYQLSIFSFNVEHFLHLFPSLMSSRVLKSIGLNSVGWSFTWIHPLFPHDQT